MKFEFDSTKSASNRSKHGVDFQAAQALWLGPLVELRARDETEQRMLVIGKIGRVYWSAIVVYRGESIRLISVRRSREDEKAIHHQHFGDDG